MEDLIPSLEIENISGVSSQPHILVKKLTEVVILSVFKPLIINNVRKFIRIFSTELINSLFKT